jgi:DNA-binding NarL/FixJ family response regulator
MTAREPLRQAVRTFEAARAGCHRDTHAARTSQPGRLLDAFEEGGRRYGLARENEPRARGPEALTQWGRNVIMYTARSFSTKEVAYGLGIREATVRAPPVRAARRCGVRERSEVLTLFAPPGSRHAL